MSVTLWNEEAYATLRKMFPTETRSMSNSVDSLAEVFQEEIDRAARMLIKEVSWYSCQDYWHLVQHHAADLLRARGSIGLFSASGIEQVHQVLKGDVRKHWNGTMSSQKNTQELMKRWLWRTIPGGFPTSPADA